MDQGQVPTKAAQKRANKQRRKEEEKQRIAQWNAEMKASKRREDAVDAIRDKIRGRKLEAAYERCRLESLELCAAVYAALPRELRDMVYDQLIAYRARWHVMEALDEQGRPRVSSNPLISLSYFDIKGIMPEEARIRRDTWQFIEYTGQTIGQEIAERWYHTSLFILSSEDNILGKFLNTDVWNRRILAGKAVRHIHYKMIDRSYGSGTGIVVGEVEQMSKFFSPETEIVLLLSWEANTNHGWGTLLRPLVIMMRTLRPIVRRLHDDGFRKVRVHQTCVDIKKRDITHVFKMDDDDFKKRFNLVLLDRNAEAAWKAVEILQNQT